VKKLYNEELHNLYLSPNVIRIIKSRILDGQGMYHAWGEEEGIQNFDG
jgi:hypothetical protein